MNTSASKSDPEQALHVSTKVWYSNNKMHEYMIWLNEVLKYYIHDGHDQLWKYYDVVKYEICGLVRNRVSTGCECIWSWINWFLNSNI